MECFKHRFDKSFENSKSFVTAFQSRSGRGNGVASFELAQAMHPHRRCLHSDAEPERKGLASAGTAQRSRQAVQPTLNSRGGTWTPRGCLGVDARHSGPCRALWLPEVKGSYGISPLLRVEIHSAI